MAVSKQFTAYLEQQLKEAVGQQITLKHASSVSGGSINKAFCLHTTAGDYMMKCNSKTAFPAMFTHEANGLTAIGNTKTIAVPQIILLNDFENDSFLILEWVESVRPTAAASVALGRQLAAMHRHTDNAFGFHENNYMGSIPQSNRKHNNWAAFFVQERLQPMVQIAVDKKLLSK